MATLEEIFADAKVKAENASNIADVWANGDATTSVSTASGDLPSLLKFTTDNATDNALDIDLTSGDNVISTTTFISYRYFRAINNTVVRNITIPVGMAKHFFVENTGTADVNVLNGSGSVTVGVGETKYLYTDGTLNSLIDIIASASAGVNVAYTNQLQAFTKRQSGTTTTLVDGTTITPDMNTTNNFKVVLGGNRTMANPSNPIGDTSGHFAIVQDATGSRTLAWGSNYVNIPSTLSTTANAIDYIPYDTVDDGVTVWIILGSVVNNINGA